MKTIFQQKVLLFNLLTFFLISVSPILAQKTIYEEKETLVNGEVVTIYMPESVEKDEIYVIEKNLAIGDSCNDPIALTLNGSSVQHTLINASDSGIEPSCANNAIVDSWFVTQADENGTLKISFSSDNTTGLDFGFTTWVDCSGTNSAQCRNAPIGFLSSNTSTNYNPNQTVYIQIWAYSNIDQVFTINAASECSIKTNESVILEQVCDVNTATYSQKFSIKYATIIPNATIEVKDENFTTVATIPATSNPQEIIIQDLIADGSSQQYFIGLDVCGSYYSFNWIAPNDDCSLKGAVCSDATLLPLNDYHGLCIDLRTGDNSGKTPPCINPSNTDFKDFWFQATSDDIGSLRFEINEANYSQNLTLGYALYEDCNSNAVLCGVAPNSHHLKVTVPAINRVANKTWYLQVWIYNGQGQNICINALPDCGVVSAELGAANCLDETTFSQELTIEHFNVEGTLEVLDPLNGFATLLTEDITSNPQTLTLTNLDASAAEIDLFVVFNEHSCLTHYFDNIPLPNCNANNACETDLILSGNSLAGDYLASSTIKTKTGIETIINQNTAFKAGETITLNSGFQVTNGTVFSATIEDCSEMVLEEPIASTQNKFITPINRLSVSSNKVSLAVSPNPFSQSTTINYSLPNSEEITLQVVDFMGKQVSILEQGIQKNKGNHQTIFYPKELANGIYFVVLQSGTYYEVQKILLQQY